MASDQLNSAIESIQQFTAQGDILRALLDGAAQFSGRTALFIVKGSALAGWQGRGFSQEDGVRNAAVDGNQGLASRVLRDRTPAAASAREFDANFINQQGAPADGNAWLFPLMVRDKVAALLYCDVGAQAGARLDTSAMKILTRAAGQWLELLAARKAAGTPTEPARPGVPAAPPVQAPAPPPVAHAPAYTAPAAPTITPGDQEIHAKAKRFAKLLVDEIKLYNQAKVNEGRQNRTVYKLLREDIEKSRETYNKRYSNTSVAAANYFSQEVVRILADNNAELLGSDFPG